MAVKHVPPKTDVPDENQPVTFNARLSRRMKNALQRAADLRGQSLSDFVLGSAYDRAVETIAAEDLIRLSARDTEAFARAIEAPEPVSEGVLERFRDAHRRSQQ